MMKKIAALVICASMALSVTACGNGGGNNASTQENQKEAPSFDSTESTKKSRWT